MQSRSFALWAGIAVLAITGCAPRTVPQNPAPTTPDPVHQVRVTIADRPAIPGADRMLPDAQLVTFPVRRDGAVVRDTIRGAARVAAFLDRLAAQSGGGRTSFHLEPREILVCEGAAVERGRYQLPNTDRLQYVALWRPANDAWKLAGLWLTPPRRVRPATLAEGCVTDAAASSLRVGVTLGPGSGPGLDDVAAAFNDAGYSDQTGGEGRRLHVDLWAAWDVTSRIALKVGYDHVGSKLETSAGPGYTRDLEVGIHTLRVTGETRLGPIWIEAGPALAIVRAAYVSAIVTTTTAIRYDESDTVVNPGAVVSATYSRPLWSNLAGDISVAYSVFADAGLTETVPDVSIGLPGPSLTVGLEWRP